MALKPDVSPEDLASAYLALLAQHDVVVAERDTVVAERNIAVAQAANAQAMLSDRDALIASLELRIDKLKRELHGQSSERSARLIDQLELQLEELVTAASEDEVAAHAAAAKTSNVRPFVRKRPVRKPWPEDVERERVVIDPPSTCVCCGGSRLSKLGEDVTETLEEVPRRFKVIETVREKFTCRDCEAISQSPAPFHATPRGFIGPQLLATILFDKFGMHSPLNRQSTRFKCEGIDLSTSTLGDQVGLGTSALMPLFDLIEGDTSSCDLARQIFASYIKAGKLTIINALVTRGNVSKLLDEVNAPAEFDLMSVDIDHNTSHIWREIDRTARVVCVEYNASLPCYIPLEVGYQDDAIWDGSNYFGANLKALELIGRGKGLHLVGCDIQGVNAYFVDENETEGKFAAPFTAENHHEMPRYAILPHIGHPPAQSAMSWLRSSEQ